MAKIQANTMSIDEAKLFVALLSLDKALLAQSDAETKALYVRSRNALNKEKKFTLLSSDTQQALVERIALLGDSGRDYLFQRNYKTLDRILDAGLMIDNKKSSTILTYVGRVLKRSKSTNLTTDQICGQSSQCYARVSNALKAFAFWGYVKPHGTHAMYRESTFVDKLSKETRWEWVSK